MSSLAKPKKLPIIKINSATKDIFDFKYDDFLP